MALLLLLLSPRGRIGRLRHLLGNLLVLGALGVLGLGGWLAVFRPVAEGRSGLPMGVVLPFILLWFAALLMGAWSIVALTVKRLHDIGLSGWHLAWIVVVGSVPGNLPPGSIPAELHLALQVAALLASAWIFVWPGTTGPNRYDEPGPTTAPPRLPWRQPPP